jgi:hypothetical protein
LENRRADGTGSVWGIGTSGKGEVVGKGVGGCVHMYVSGKMIPVETISRMGGGGDKGEWWKEFFKNHIIDLKSTYEGEHTILDFRSRANAAMWLDLDHITRGEHIGEI